MTRRLPSWSVAPCLPCLSLFLVSCSPSSPGAGSEEQTIQNTGSDTMVNLAQAWAEAYEKVKPKVLVQVSAGGSQVGISALAEGAADIANSSRPLKPVEVEMIKKRTGKDHKESIAGYDALAVYVHKDNPLETISIEELAEVYAEGGKITRWSQLGVKNQGCPSDEIILLSRQSSSGTYLYFREMVLGKREYRQGTRDMNGSKDVVEVAGSTPCAIGYSGMGYKTHEVKFLKVSAKKGEPGLEPSIKSVLDKTYPIARPLYMYTAGEPEGTVKDYLDWIHSPEGQKIVEETGYVPLPKN